MTSIVGLVVAGIAVVGLAFWTLGHPKDVTARRSLVDVVRAMPSGILMAAAWSTISVGLAALFTFPFGNRLMVAVVLAGAIGVPLFFTATWLIIRAILKPQHYADALLQAYHIGKSILTEHGLREFLVELFDHAYYPRASIDRAIDASLGRDDSPPSENETTERLRVGDYSARERLQPIHLGLAVASTETGHLDVVSRGTPLIDGLLAAVAMVPFLPGKELISKPGPDQPRRRRLYVDGANVAREPTHALLSLLRDRLHKKTRAVHIYTVTPFPVSQGALGRSTGGQLAPDREESNESSQRVRDAPGSTVVTNAPTATRQWLNLVDIALRANSLQRFRDATLERRLTELFSQLIDDDDVGVVKIGVERKNVFRAWMTLIELERDAGLNGRILGASKETRRSAVYETVADGCRASLQVMLARTLKEHGVDVEVNGAQENRRAKKMKCADAVARHAERTGIVPELRTVDRPASSPEIGPGLSEICRHCSLWRGEKRAEPQTLLLGDWEKLGPEWPHERDPNADADVNVADRFRARGGDSACRKRALQAIEAARLTGQMSNWPRSREAPDEADRTRPTVSLLFSGGVFRGVYQIGVLNALSEVRAKPDLIAGASVGAITAAMGADALSQKERCLERARIARVACAYLAIDRIVLTDRLADFVRNLTLRAAETRFSVREADRFFRKYDSPTWREFDRNARRVIAGIERLLYLSPFQLLELIMAFRKRGATKVGRLARDVIQQYLDRMQIGQEALGAEPLRELIVEYVTGARTSNNPRGFSIDELRTQSQVQFLATATDLTNGSLIIFG